MHRAGLVRCLSALGALVWSGASPAQVERPLAASRIVQMFDFEERPQNPEPVPMHWIRAQDAPPERSRPGFPAWNKAAFDTAHQVSGQHSVLLPTQGGSVSLRLASGVLPAIPGADYRILAKVRTDGLSHAKARMSARYLNGVGQPLIASESESRLVSTKGAWETIEVGLQGHHRDAAWIQIDLELLQPRDQASRVSSSAGWAADDNEVGIAARHQVWLEDVSGGAWFDDVMALQTPRVELGTRGPANITVGPDLPVIRIVLRDLTGERLRARATVIDLQGNVEATQEFMLPVGGGQTDWTPQLNGYGWRRVRLETMSDGEVVAAEEAAFVWVPASEPTQESDRFSLLVEGLAPHELGNLPAMADATGSGAVQISVWETGVTRQSLPGMIDTLDELVRRLTDKHIIVGFSLGRTPIELTRLLGLEPDNVIGALTAPGDKTGAPPPAEQYLGAMLSKFGQRIRRWQLGRTGDAEAFWRPALHEELRQVQTMFARLVPRPEITLPWSLEQSLDERLPSGQRLTVTLPAGTPLDAIGAYAARWRGNADVTLMLEPATGPDPYDAAVELMKRAVMAWAAGAPRLAVERPWSVGGGALNREQPTPVFAVWRQVAQRLGGRRVVGELPVAEGARCLILDGPRGGALVGWRDWAAPEDAVIETRLAETPVRIVDAFGNETIAEMTDGLHRVELGTTPVFVEGINVPLALFRAGFSVQPAYLPAEARLHRLELELKNPWPMPISGVLRVVEPSTWKIEPRVVAFDIPADQTLRVPVDVSFGLGEEAGMKRLVVDAEILADRKYPRVRATAPIELGLMETDLTPSFSFLPDADGKLTDVAVTLSITNNGSESVTLQAFAMAPGYAREQAPVSDLGPGESAVRRFVFPGGAEKLMGKRIRVGLIEVGGTGRLNRSLFIQ